jgi:hypothetical protein
LGCSIHPLPGDLPRVATFDIVDRIRCEAQEGLLTFPREDPLVQKIVTGTLIGYDFLFDITETNDLGTAKDPGKLTFQRPGSGKNLFNLDLTASAEKSRQNTRRFRIVEELGKLYDAKCSPEEARANWVYPITGATGMGEVVRTFIRIEALGNLQQVAPKPLPGFKDVTSNIVFSDVLKFMTTLDATAKPTLTLVPVAGRLKVTSASITGEAKREDTHSVIVALARDKVEIERPPGGVVLMRRSAAPSALVAASRPESRALVDRGAVRDGRQVRALVQKDSDAYTRVIIELQRLRDLEDDDREAPRLLGEKILELLRTP